MRPLIFILLCAWPVIVQAQKAEVTIKYYDVDALTPQAMIKQMRQRGPDGFWGYASWWVEWSARCKVTVTGTITFPRHTRMNALSTGDRVIWEEMTAALMQHERNHIRHGEKAAAEIKANNCRNGNRIIRKWADEDRKYDRRTKHGETEGVDLIPG